ncbi:hypothetical protein [Actinomyces vulturis]|uniref:hypothetical protein n=1 Tax=Actinomyces vulturis TaxID=1857645 RepID=UPI0008313DCB|nr:hypothetical protein [Actinomyces vulturis]
MNKVEKLRKAIVDGNVDELIHSWLPEIYGIAQGEGNRLQRHLSNEDRRDIQAMALEVLTIMINEEADGRARLVYNFDAHLKMRLRNRVQSWADSESGFAPAAKMSSLLRRRRIIRSHMRANGTTAKESVDWLNQHGNKSNGLYRLSDLEPMNSVSMDTDEFRLTHDEIVEVSMQPTAGYLLAPCESAMFVEEVCQRLEGNCRMVARAWLTTAWQCDEPETAQSLSEDLHIPVSEVKKHIESARKQAKALLCS